MATKKKSKAESQAELSSNNGVADQVAPTQQPAPEVKEAPVVEKTKGPGKIAQILSLFKSGMSTKDIAKQLVRDDEGNFIKTGEKDSEGNDILETFHPTTISIQVSKYKKQNPDLYPPQPAAPTKKELAAKAKAEKEAAAAKEKEEASADASNEKA